MPQGRNLRRHTAKTRKGIYHVVRGELPTESDLERQKRSSLAQLSEIKINSNESGTNLNSEPEYSTKAESAQSSVVLSPRAGADAGKTCTITDLPPELISNIIKYLDPVQAVCVGLTNKKHYILNKYINRDPVDLGELIVLREDALFQETRPVWQPLFLHVTIREFMKRGGWEYNHRRCIFNKKGESLKSN